MKAHEQSASEDRLVCSVLMGALAPGERVLKGEIKILGFAGMSSTHLGTLPRFGRRDSNEAVSLLILPDHLARVRWQ
jgi:hypothetical protein